MDIKALASSSRGNAYIIDNGTNPVLLECGLKVKALREKADYKLTSMAGCLLSHEHSDHSRSAAAIMDLGVDLYTGKGTADKLGLQGHRLHIIEAERTFQLADWEITPFALDHNAAEPLGFLMESKGEKLLWASDTCRVNYNVEGLNYIMLDANYRRQYAWDNYQQGNLNGYLVRLLKDTHMEIEDVKRYFQRTDLSAVKEIWLLHLSEKNADPEEFKREIQLVTGKQVILAEAPDTCRGKEAVG